MADGDSAVWPAWVRAWMGSCLSPLNGPLWTLECPSFCFCHGWKAAVETLYCLVFPSFTLAFLKAKICNIKCASSTGVRSEDARASSFDSQPRSIVAKICSFQLLVSKHSFVVSLAPCRTFCILHPVLSFPDLPWYVHMCPGSTLPLSQPSPAFNAYPDACVPYHRLKQFISAESCCVPLFNTQLQLVGSLLDPFLELGICKCLTYLSVSSIHLQDLSITSLQNQIWQT